MQVAKDIESSVDAQLGIESAQAAASTDQDQVGEWSGGAADDGEGGTSEAGNGWGGEDGELQPLEAPLSARVEMEDAPSPSVSDTLTTPSPKEIVTEPTVPVAAATTAVSAAVAVACPQPAPTPAATKATKKKAKKKGEKQQTKTASPPATPAQAPAPAPEPPKPDNDELKKKVPSPPKPSVNLASATQAAPTLIPVPAAKAEIQTTDASLPDAITKLAQLEQQLSIALEELGEKDAELEAMKERLAAREEQLLNVGSKGAAVAEVIAEENEMAVNRLKTQLSALQGQNEKLQAKVASLEQMTADTDAMKEEMTERVAAAERRVYALTKERDMLRKETERKGDSAMLLREKDNIIKEVMEEGEKLSKKQAEMEGMIKKNRATIKELEAERDRLKSGLKDEEAKLEALARDKEAAEEDFKTAVDRTAKELEDQKAYYVEQLTKARSAAAAAEAAADGEARGNLEAELKEAAAREEALRDQVDGLRGAMTRAAEAAARREERAAADAREIERRCQEAEERHEELARRLPESTRPLLRQIEAMRVQQSEQADAWAGTERFLQARAADAEALAAAAAAREAAALEEAVDAKAAARAAQALAARMQSEAAAAARALAAERAAAEEERDRVRASFENAAQQEGRMHALEDEAREREGRLRRQLAEERGHHEAAMAAWERDRRELMEREAEILAQQRQLTAKLAEKESISSSSAHGPGGGPGGEREEGVSAALAKAAKSVAVGGEGGVQLAIDRATEALQRQIRAREAELDIAEERVRSLEATRDSLANELVAASRLIDEVGNPEELSAELRELEERHVAALELMGETSEENEELRESVKGLKATVESLTEKLAASGKSS